MYWPLIGHRPTQAYFNITYHFHQHGAVFLIARDITFHFVIKEIEVSLFISKQMCRCNYTNGCLCMLCLLCMSISCANIPLNSILSNSWTMYTVTYASRFKHFCAKRIYTNVYVSINIYFIHDIIHPLHYQYGNPVAPISKISSMSHICVVKTGSYFSNCGYAAENPSAPPISPGADLGPLLLTWFDFNPTMDK